MAQNVTKVDIVFPDFRIERTTDENNVLHYWVNVGYTITTNEEPILKSRRRELTGANATTAANLFNTIYNQLKGIEGIP
jgi:hypothetical protein